MLKLLLLSSFITALFGIAINNPDAVCKSYDNNIAFSVISSVPERTKFIRAKGNIPPLIERLIDNATTIREDIRDTFTCKNRVYGYYADQDNDCQIFHICVPMHQLFPDLYCADDIFHFSFICPQHTIFSQEAMVCAWTDNAFPCSEADKLYARNNLFFVVPEEDVQRESSLVAEPTSPPPKSSMCCSSKLQYTDSIPRKKLNTLSDFSQLITSTEAPNESQIFPTTYPTTSKPFEQTSMIEKTTEPVTTWPSNIITTLRSAGTFLPRQTLTSSSSSSDPPGHEALLPPTDPSTPFTSSDSQSLDATELELLTSSDSKISTVTEPEYIYSEPLTDVQSELFLTTDTQLPTVTEYDQFLLPDSTTIQDNEQEFFTSSYYQQHTDTESDIITEPILDFTTSPSEENEKQTQNPSHDSLTSLFPVYIPTTPQTVSQDRSSKQSHSRSRNMPPIVYIKNYGFYTL